MDARTLCLGALECGDASGYEIRKMFEDGLFSSLHHASYGSIYPALNRLQQEGMTTVTAQVQDGRPDKKVYSLTPAGHAAFVEALKRPPGPDRFRSDALFTLAFAEFLPVGTRTAVLDAYVAEYDSQLAEIDREEAEGGSSPGAVFLREFGRTICRTIVTYVAENRHLLETVDGPAETKPTGGER